MSWILVLILLCACELVVIAVMSTLSWIHARKHAVPVPQPPANAGMWNITPQVPNLDSNIDKTIRMTLGDIEKFLHVDSATATTIEDDAKAQQFGLIAHGTGDIHASYLIVTAINNALFTLNADGVFRPHGTGDPVSVTIQKDTQAMIALTKNCDALNKIVHIGNDNTVILEDIIPFGVLAEPQSTSSTDPTTLLRLSAGQRFSAQRVTHVSNAYYITATVTKVDPITCQTTVQTLYMCTLQRIWNSSKTWTLFFDTESDDFIHKAWTADLQKTLLKYQNVFTGLFLSGDIALACQFTMSEVSIRLCDDTSSPRYVFTCEVLPSDDTVHTYHFALSLGGYIRLLPTPDLPQDSTQPVVYTFGIPGLTADPLLITPDFGPTLSLVLIASTNTKFQQNLAHISSFQQFTLSQNMIHWSDSTNGLWNNTAWYVNMNPTFNPDIQKTENEWIGDSFLSIFYTAPLPSQTHAQTNVPSVYLTPITKIRIQA